MSALILTLAGAVVGAVITWALGAGDRKLAKQALSAQQKIAELEAERNRIERAARFRPKSKVVDIGNTQHLQLEAVDSFEVVSIDYLNSDRAILASEDVGKTGANINIPLTQRYLVEVMNRGPWTREYDHSANVILRVRINKDGYPSDHEHSSYWDGAKMRLIG